MSDETQISGTQREGGGLVEEWRSVPIWLEGVEERISHGGSVEDVEANSTGGWRRSEVFIKNSELEQRHRMISGCHSRCAAGCLLYTSPSPRDTERSRMPSSA